MTPEHIITPLRFSPRCCDPSTCGAKPAPLRHQILPTGSLRSTLRDRLAIKPQLDLGVYTCRAAIDWVYLEVELKRTTQSLALSRFIAPANGPTPKVLEPGKRHDEKVFNANGRKFRVKIQNPTPQDMALLEANIDAKFGLASPARVIGIEVAVDWFSNDGSDQARWEMVAALQRHHLPMIGGLDHAAADLRHTYAPADSDKDSTTAFVIQDIRHVEAGGEDAGRRFSDLNVAEQEVRKRLLRVDGHVGAFIDSTVYRGGRHDPVMFRIQNKVTDERHPVSGVVRSLPPRERRARIEVTLLDDAVARAGICGVSDLFGERFSKLRKDHFGFWLPTIPRADSGPRAMLWNPLMTRAFKESGVYGIALIAAAIDEEAKSNRAQRRSRGEEVRKMPRIRIGERGRLIAWRRMNRRTHEALRRLDGAWAREGLKGAPSAVPIAAE